MNDPKVGTVISCNGQVCLPGVVSGCSSPNGHYAMKHMVAEALSLGWHDEMAAGAVETYDDHHFREDWPHRDHWHDMVTEAEDWLNDHTDGGMWMWTDGDFRLVRTGECPWCTSTAWAEPAPEQRDCPDHLDGWD